MRIFRLSVVLVVIVGCSFIGYGRKTYVCYYESSSAQDTELNIMNLMDRACWYTLRIYYYKGKLLYSDMCQLKAFEAEFYRVSEEVGRGFDIWGMVTIEVDDDVFILLSVEYFVEDQVCSIDNIIEAVPPYESGYWYWYCIYHVNLWPSSTGLVIMNPSWSTVSYRIRVYDAHGAMLFSRSYTLAGRCSNFFDLEDLVGQGEEIWGLVDIRADRPVALAGEYYKRSGSRLEIDNIVDYYGKSRQTSM